MHCRLVADSFILCLAMSFAAAPATGQSPAASPARRPASISARSKPPVPEQGLPSQLSHFTVPSKVRSLYKKAVLSLDHGNRDDSLRK